MKRIILSILAAVLLVCLPAGCAAKKNAEPPAAQPGDTAAVPGTSAPMTEAPVTEAPGTDAPETEIHVTGEPVTVPEEPVLDLQFDRIWRSEQEDAPGKGELIRELTLEYSEFTFYFRAGEPYSEYFYFVRGSWSLDGDRLHLEGIQLDEFDNVLPDASKVEAGYTAEIRDGKLILTSVGEATALLEDPGTPVVFELKESDD